MSAQPATYTLVSGQHKDLQENTYPRETVEFGLITSRQLPVHRRQCGLLASKFFVEIARIGVAVLHKTELRLDDNYKE